MSSNPADLDVAEASELLAARSLSASELVKACLARIRERDGTHSHDGDPASVNAWVRVYDEDALAAARACDERLSAAAAERDGPAPALCGVPIGLKDLYGVAGKPLTASSRLLDEVPVADCDAWARLRAHGMILLGHLHTHEFAFGGTTDQVGSPWSLDRSAGGSSGGSAAALAGRMTPAATGTDTGGSLRIPSALSGTSAIKPTPGLVSLAGIVPLSTTFDHAGPMARTLADCALLLAAMAGRDRRKPASAARWPVRELPSPRDALRPLAGLRLALSPRVGTVTLDADVSEGFERVVTLCRELGAEIVDPRPPTASLDPGEDFMDILLPEFLLYHRRFDTQGDLYRPALQEWRAEADRRRVTAEAYLAAQERRGEATVRWDDWLAVERVDAIVEPTVPVVAPLRGPGYDHAGSDWDLISLTHYWNWVAFPVVAFPGGIGSRSGLPVGVSLIGAPATDIELLGIGIELQARLGVPVPPWPFAKG
jgi:aspartyl-tRNA(Asn)/glutamyl-tRNA(Gln) amidotransferase subunit A